MFQQQERRQRRRGTGCYENVTGRNRRLAIIAPSLADTIAAVTRGPAIWATAVALALVNVGLAALIVAAIGATSFAPLWVGVVVLVAGVVAAAGAVVLWRRYLASAREF
jgi:hypothetical protein